MTEDCDLGLRMASYGLKTAMLDSTTYEEANSRVKNWIRQRSRWIKGYMQTYLVYMRQPQVYLRKGRLREFFSLQLFVGGKTAVLFVNPFMWVLAAIYILFRPIDVYHTLFPAPVLYMGTMCLIFGNFFYTYSHLIGCMKRGHYHLVKWTLLIPIYWAMASVAAFMALQQLIFKPHYWEKTQHGLHLNSSASSLRVISVTEEPYTAAEQLELELIEKTVKLKVRASRDLTPALPQPEEFEFEGETLKLPALELDPGPSFSREFELGDETLESLATNEGYPRRGTLPGGQVIVDFKSLELSAVQAEKYTSKQRVLLISAVPTKALPTIPLPNVERSEGC